MATRRSRWFDWLIIAAIPGAIGAIYLYHRMETRPYLDRIAAGGGEPRFVAVEWMRCREFPGQKPRREKLNRFRGSAMPPAVEHRDPFAVVARQDGFALGGVDGEICWLPDWALRAQEPRWLPCDQRSAGYYTPYPAGWYEPPPAFGGPGRSCPGGAKASAALPPRESER